MNPYKPPVESPDPDRPAFWVRVVVWAYLAIFVLDQFFVLTNGFEEIARLGPFSIGHGRWP